MTTFTAHDKDIPNVPGVTPEQAETVLALIEARGEPDYLVQMLGLDGAESVPTGDLKGSARRHSRKRVVGVKA